MKQFKPYIPADKVMPELTPTSVILGIILAVHRKAPLTAHQDDGFPIGTQEHDGIRFHPCCRSFYGYCAHDHAPRFYSGK